jgi:hypothetical protein
LEEVTVKKLAVLFAVLGMPALALAAEWQNVPMVDSMCQPKMKDNPDGHPVSCALKCGDSGFQIRTAENTWVKLDGAGNKLALAALKSAKKKDHIRVDVSGEQKGDVIAVSALKMAD